MRLVKNEAALIKRTNFKDLQLSFDTLFSISQPPLTRFFQVSTKSLGRPIVRTRDSGTFAIADMIYFTFQICNTAIEKKNRSTWNVVERAIQIEAAVFSTHFPLK